MTDRHREILVDSIGADQNKALKLLHSIARIVEATNSRSRYHTKINHVLTVILQYLGVEQGSIMVVERKKLLIAAATRSDLVGLKQPINEDSIAGWVATHKTPIFIPDISQDGRFNKRTGKAYKKNSLLSVPVLQDTKLIGVINVTDKSGDTDLLQEDVTYLLDFGSLMISTLVQRSLQTELRKQKATLRKKNQELHRQERLRDELSRLLMHDLKAPLSEIVANLDILSYSITGEQLEFLEAAQVSCDRTVRMVGNLVTINKIEDGKMTLFPEETEVQNLLEEALSAIQGMAKIKGVSVVLELPKIELPTPHLDRVLILRVLQNLLTNALGHSDPGGTITLGCFTGPSETILEFYVRDEGEGIPEEKQQTIFDKYSRLSDSHDTLVGTGLGLYFCRLAVEVHGGRIGIENQPQKGCRFFFTLPISL